MYYVQVINARTLGLRRPHSALMENTNQVQGGRHVTRARPGINAPIRRQPLPAWRAHTLQQALSYVPSVLKVSVVSMKLNWKLSKCPIITKY